MVSRCCPSDVAQSRVIATTPRSRKGAGIAALLPFGHSGPRRQAYSDTDVERLLHTIAARVRRWLRKHGRLWEPATTFRPMILRPRNPRCCRTRSGKAFLAGAACFGRGVRSTMAGSNQPEEATHG
jgi:phytoene dehydrogenase-like protein